MSHSERPLRAEDALAKLKRSRDQPLSPEAAAGKRQKRHDPADASDASDAPGQPTGAKTAPSTVPAGLDTTTTNNGASVVNSRPVLDEVAHFQRRQLGSVVYAPHRLVARGHELDFNCVLQVRISHSFLREDADNDAVATRRLWGTDVYTDDTDLVAALFHLGHLPRPSPAHTDLLVEILLLPGLKRYTGSDRHGIRSRTWLKRHDGISYMVLGPPREMPAGWATSGKDTLYERFQALQELRKWDAKNIVYI